MSFDEFDTKTQIAILKVQSDRFVSDVESEKRTRADVNRTILDRLGRVEKLSWVGIGIILTVQFFVTTFVVYLIERK